MGISRMWRLVEHLAHLKLGSGSRIGFWINFWVGPSTLKELFPSLFRIALLPQGSVADHWDHTLSLFRIADHLIGPFPLEEA